MKFKELKKSLTEKVEPIYLVYGEDAFFVERSLKLICDACLKEPDINLTVFEGAEIKGNAEKLVSALTCYPFLSEKRVVVAKDYYPLAADAAKLKKYCEEPMPTTVFVVLSPAGCETIAKMKNVATVDCSKGDFRLLSGWIINELKKSGIVIGESALTALIDYCKYDMTRINGETMKLAAYCADSKIVEKEDVDALCVKETDYQLYEVVDFIASGNCDKAYLVMADMLAGSGDGQRLFVSLYNHFRRLLYVSLARQSMTDEEIAKILKIKEYAVKKTREQARRFSPVRLKAVTDKLAGYDAAFKCGEVEQQDALLNGVMSVLIG